MLNSKFSSRPATVAPAELSRQPPAVETIQCVEIALCSEPPHQNFESNQYGRQRGPPFPPPKIGSLLWQEESKLEPTEIC